MSSYMPLPIGSGNNTPTMAANPVTGQEDYVYNRLLKERIIWLGSEVRDSNANLICSQMLLLSAEDPEADIYLYINSPGGSVTAGMAIYDTMQLIPNDVVTVVTGMAASMGQFLLTAGAMGKRYATPNARILMHQPLGGIGGTSTVLIGIAIAASTAMCLPISTPPNAIAYSTGLIEQKDMLKTGLTCGLVSIILGYILLYFIGEIHFLG